MDSLSFMWQQVLGKENSDLKPVKRHLKIELYLNSTNVDRMVTTYLSVCKMTI